MLRSGFRDVIEAINPVIRGWGNYYRKAHVRQLFHRMDGWIERRLRSFVMAKHGVATISTSTAGAGVRTCAADLSRARHQSVFDAAIASTQESGLRENCTSRLSERAEAGRTLHLSRLYSCEAGEQSGAPRCGAIRGGASRSGAGGAKGGVAIHLRLRCRSDLILGEELVDRQNPRRAGCR
jgi:hypothetical protein